jgi:hypothetical protein
MATRTITTGLDGRPVDTATKRDQERTFAGDALDSARLTLREAAKVLDRHGDRAAAHAARQAILCVDTALGEMAR